jgi:hypothetical protein
MGNLVQVPLELSEMLRFSSFILTAISQYIEQCLGELGHHE